MSKYTVDYFIKKFKRIPRNKWLVGDYSYDGKCCALGHCGERMDKSTRESTALKSLLDGRILTNINDGWSSNYKQKHPKTRILAALADVKKGIFDENF